MDTLVEFQNSRPFGGRVLHAIAHLAFTVGRYVVDTAVEQQRRAPGSVGVVLSGDLDDALQSSPVLVAELEGHSIPVYRCGDFFKRDAAGLRASADALRQVLGTAQVVHAHTAMAAAVARWAGAPTVIVTFHGWNQDRPAHIDLQDAMAFSLADRTIAVSDYWANVLQTKAGVPAVAVLPYGLCLDRHAQRPIAHRDRRAPRIVVAGELSDRMATDLILNAMARLWEDIPNAEVHFFGEGSAREKTQKLALSLDPSGTRCVFHGSVPDLYARLDEFDVFARANRSDDQPVPVMQAMLAGLPSVGTPVGSQSLWSKKSRSGLIVPKDAPRRFAAALKVLLTMTTRGREEMGDAASSFARAQFNIRQHVARLESLYASQVAAKPLPHAPFTPPSDGPVKLHLGCGPDHRDGWINVDARAVVNPDVVAAVDALPMFDNDTVDTIEACHLLEHLPIHEATRAFEEWFRLLKSGGTLYLELPNLDACVEMLGRHKDGNGDDLGMIGIFGWPTGVENDGVAQVHKWGWTPDSLAEALQQAGFAHVQREPITQTWRPAARVDRDFRVRAIKPVH